MQDQRRTIRPWVAFGAVVLAVVCVVALRDVQVTSQIRSLRAEKQELMTDQEELKGRLQSAEASVAEFQSRSVAQPFEVPSSAPDSKAQARVAALEAQVKVLQSAAQRRAAGPQVPEYDPTNPQSQSGFLESNELPTNTVPMRSWGTEQVLGAPNTERAGDLPTAWASREPDAGPEWLAAGFDQAVDIAEVRVRETFNPGAISKITALVLGGEVVLWEGTASGGVALRDFVIPVPGNVRADSVIIHLDSARVPGWNEIDAVELVGRDGSRQWATSSSASSTYAEPRTPESPPASGPRR